jgi:hypothetical protein
MIIGGAMSKEAKGGGLSKEQGEKLIAKLRAMREEGLKQFEAKTFPCPVDASQSNYAGMTGIFPIAVPVFQCPDGHKFSVRRIGEGKDAMKLISDQGPTPSSGETK